MDIGLSPTLALGPLHVAWHGLFGLLAVLAAGVVGVRRGAARVGFDAAYAVAIAGVVGGLIGSRAFHVVDQLPYYLAHPAQALAVWDGGESVIGGIVGGLAGGMIVVVRRGLPRGYLLDCGGLALPLGMAIGRVGDVVNGEHHATACAGVPWCVRYTAPDTLGQRDLVHPAVAYELVLDLAIFAVLVALSARRPRDGTLVLAFLGLYGAGRLLLSAYRLDPPWIAGLTQAQIVSALFVVIALVAVVLRRRAGASTSASI